MLVLSNKLLLDSNKPQPIFVWDNLKSTVCWLSTNNSIDDILHSNNNIKLRMKLFAQHYFGSTLESSNKPTVDVNIYP